MVHTFNHSTQRQRQADLCEFEDSLVYRVNSRAVSHRNAVSKNKQHTNKQIIKILLLLICPSSFCIKNAIFSLSYNFTSLLFLPVLFWFLIFFHAETIFHCPWFGFFWFLALVFWFFKTGFLCIALAVVLELTHSLCRPGWPRTQKSTCLFLPSTGIKGVCHNYPA